MGVEKWTINILQALGKIEECKRQNWLEIDNKYTNKEFMN